MLPRIDTPTYEITLPSTGKKTRFRPFLVKEEKILLMAQQGEDIKEKIHAIKQIIRNCLIEDIDIDKLATFDIEYLFVNLRSKSVGNIINLTYKRTECPNKDDGAGDCDIPFTMDLENVAVQETDENHSTTIELTDRINLVMKYPDFHILNSILQSENYDDIVEVIAECIEYITEDDEVLNATDYTTQELVDFIENLTQNQFASINDFFETMPETSCAVNIRCRKCDFKKEMKVSGVADFFS
jgi:hypothetical protein